MEINKKKFKLIKHDSFSLEIAFIEKFNGWYKTDYGVCYHFKNGFLHSSNDEPATFYPSTNSYEWYKKGKLHRESGPAISLIEEKVFIWFLNGEETEEEDVIAFVNSQKLNKNFPKAKNKNKIKI